MRFRGRRAFERERPGIFKGIGTYGDSEIEIALGGAYDIFESYIGVDDYVPTYAGSIIFRVYGDDELLYESDEMTGADDPEKISVPVSGVNVLRLVTDNNGSSTNDYADWALACVTKGTTAATGVFAENPLRFCGEYMDLETGFIYLRNRYYDPSTGSFLTEDPARDGTNWYIYCANNPIMFIDPTGEIREPQWIDGRWVENPDAEEFGANSDTYKILVDLGNRWWEADEAGRKALNEMANDARRLAREGTPYKFGDEIILETLHANTQQALQYIEEAKNSIWSGLLVNAYTMSYTWFVNMTCNDWDYKWDPNWQVPYSTFNGEDMNKAQSDGGSPKNWYPWIYFQGQLMGADKVGNLNLGYVGRRMGFDGIMLVNDATAGGGDGYWVQYGIDMAALGW